MDVTDIAAGVSPELAAEFQEALEDLAKGIRRPEKIQAACERMDRFEKLLYLAAKRGDADLVAERLTWGIHPNCVFSEGRTPLIANVRGSNPSAATVRTLLEGGADPSRTDESGLTALDHARRKLARLQARPARRRRKSPSLDENDQLRLSSDEQEELDQMRREVGGDQDYLRIWWQERLRAARRVFNDPDQVEKIVVMLEGAGGRG